MRTPLPAVLLALLLGALSAVAVACGSESSGLLTERRADRIKGDLDRVATAVDQGDCEATGVRLEELRSELADLPASVAPSLRERLTEGVATLAQRATQECQGDRTETLETQTEPAPPAETPETTETTETETTETEPPPAETETETEPEPPAETTPTTPAPVPDPAEPETPAAPEGDAGTGGVGEGEGTTP